MIGQTAPQLVAHHLDVADPRIRERLQTGVRVRARVSERHELLRWSLGHTPTVGPVTAVRAALVVGRSARRRARNERRSRRARRLDDRDRSRAQRRQRCERRAHQPAGGRGDPAEGVRHRGGGDAQRLHRGCAQPRRGAAAPADPARVRRTRRPDEADEPRLGAVHHHARGDRKPRAPTPRSRSMPTAGRRRAAASTSSTRRPSAA